MQERIAIAHVFLTLNIGGMEKIGIDLIRRLDKNKYKHYILCLEELGPFGQELATEGYNVLSLNKNPGINILIILKIIMFFLENNLPLLLLQKRLHIRVFLEEYHPFLVQK